MFSRIVLLMAALAAFVVSPARAFTPESGFWWNRAEPGTGLNIEIQDNFLALSGYFFTADGQPTWVTAQGPMLRTDGRASNSRFTGTLATYVNGQCLGCPYRAPTAGAGAGPIAIDFLTETTADISFGGRTVRYERFDFYLTRGAAQAGTEKMLGEWQIVLDLYDRSGSNYQSYPYYGDVLIFDGVDTAANPDLYEGCRPTNSLSGGCTAAARATHDASGFYDPSDGTHVFLVTDVPDADREDRVFIAYYAKVGLDQFDGCFEICASDQCGRASSNYYPMRGFRSASRSFVTTGFGPSSDDKSQDLRSLSKQIVASGAKGTAEDVCTEPYGIRPANQSAKIATLQTK